MSFDDVLNLIVQKVKASDSLIEKHNRAYETILDAYTRQEFKLLIHSRELHKYGSFQYGFTQNDSDLDVSLFGIIDGVEGSYLFKLDKTSKVKFLKHFGKALGKLSEVRKTDLIEAAVPVLKVEFNDESKVDITVGRPSHYYKCSVIKTLRDYFPSFGVLCPLAKAFAKSQWINNPCAWTFNSYSIILLCIFTLQLRGLMPALWTILGDSPPEDDAPKIFDDENNWSEEVLEGVRQRCKHVAGAYDGANRNCTPSDLFLSFLECLNGILECPDRKQPLDRPPCDYKLSPLLGDMVPLNERESGFGFFLFLEDPFTNRENLDGEDGGPDNCCRTFQKFPLYNDGVSTLDFIQDRAKRSAVLLNFIRLHAVFESPLSNYAYDDNNNNRRCSDDGFRSRPANRRGALGVCGVETTDVSLDPQARQQMVYPVAESSFLIFTVALLFGPREMRIVCEQLISSPPYGLGNSQSGALNRFRRELKCEEKLMALARASMDSREKFIDSPSDCIKILWRLREECLKELWDLHDDENQAEFRNDAMTGRERDDFTKQWDRLRAVLFGGFSDLSCFQSKRIRDGVDGLLHEYMELCNHLESFLKRWCCS